MKAKVFLFSVIVALIAAIQTMPAAAQSNITAAEARKIAEEAYIYGYPMVDSYRIQYATSWINPIRSLKRHGIRLKTLPVCTHPMTKRFRQPTQTLHIRLLVRTFGLNLSC